MTAAMDLVGTHDGTNAESWDQLGKDLGFQSGAGLDPETRAGLVAMYGSAFPLLKQQPSEKDWITWGESLWERHTSSMQSRLHLVERNRLFRKGVQWISSVGMGPWREPDRPRDTARVVENVIAPALDQRQQLVSEQQPGFRVRPEGADPEQLKKAEARQIGLEYQYDQQEMKRTIAELAYWAGTDGCSFGEVFWDTNRGPWHKAMGIADDGSEVPLGPDGQQADEPHRFPLGDLACKVRRVEQIRVSADAKGTKRPWYMVIREVIPHASAAKEYGPDAAAAMATERPESRIRLGTVPSQRLGFLLPEEDELFREQDVVDRIVVYCEPSEYLEKGLTLIAVGKKLQHLGALTFGVVPVFRYTDGSSDPSYFPQSIMDAWVDSQMRINAVKSKWVENVRLNAGPRLIAKENAIAGETLVGGVMSVISVKGLGAINESVRPLQGFDLAQSAIGLLQSEVKAFENVSGWSDASRGAFSADQSGRAVLAIRESLERIFAPVINAACDAMVDWARISLAGMRWGYDIPRAVSVEGKSRVDLAQRLIAEDFDSSAQVFIDPETMMPMPRSLRLFLLKDMFAQQLISPQELRRRMPFAWIRNLGSPDEDQEARARRVADSIRNGMPLPILWQDNEAIHQDVLERELILPDDTPPPVRAAAQMRWQQLGMQAMMKQAPPMPLGPAGPMVHPPGPPQGMQAQGPPGGLPPSQQPFAGTNPPIAAGQNPIGVPGSAGPLSFGGHPDAIAAQAEHTLAH